MIMQMELSVKRWRNVLITHVGKEMDAIVSSPFGNKVYFLIAYIIIQHLLPFDSLHDYKYSTQEARMFSPLCTVLLSNDVNQQHESQILLTKYILHYCPVWLMVQQQSK
mmetsp:Transcript_37371/g.56965  ORF Transcript_37371/g.56965 Transcript_37371/m.56965 type:complete len:109 (-) Transcript_37371:559-885(-)